MIENSLNIYKINKLLLVTSYFSLWDMMSNQATATENL